MAYREFDNQPYYEAPDISSLGHNTMQALQTAIAAKRRRMEQNQQLANSWQADKYNANFLADQNDLNIVSNDLAKNGTSDIYHTGSLSPKTRLEANENIGLQNLSKAQWTQKEDLERGIQTHSIAGPVAGKNYANNGFYQQKLIEQNYDNEEEKKILSQLPARERLKARLSMRAEKLSNLASSVGKDYINGFDYDAYTSDYVNRKKEEVRQESNRGIGGNKTTNKVSAVFMDKDGNPKVTEEDHVIPFLDASPPMKEHFKQKIDLELLDDAKKMMATKEGAWLKDLTPTEQVEALRSDPSKNTENKLTPGQRETQRAKEYLEAKQRVILGNSYDAGSIKGDELRKGVTSTTYGVEPAFWTTAFGGPGSKLVSKKGTPFKITLKGPAMDANEGKMTGNNYSTRDMVVDGYNLSLIDKKTGKPINVQVKSPEEYVQFIKELRPDQVVQYELKPVIHGQAFNRADVISNARRERDKLTVQPNKTEAEQANLASLESVLKMSDLNPDLAPEVFQAALKNVIPNVAEDLMKVVNPKDPEVSEIASKLGPGKFKITDSKNWSSDEQMVANAWQERVNSLGHAVESPTTPVKKGKTTPTVKMITVITPDGQEGQIPEGKWAEAEKRGFKKK